MTTMLRRCAVRGAMRAMGDVRAFSIAVPATSSSATATTTAATQGDARDGDAVPRRTRPHAPVKQALELTESAAARIKALLERNAKPYLKIGIRSRGCNGMTYTMNYADEGDRKKFDELVDQRGVKIIIEPNALMSIIGTKMDYVSDRLRSEFVFENPNAKAECGCGESFTT
jgi:iron-sulfur cluster assembly 1